MNKHTTQFGLSLVELMISMALASIIAAAAIAMLVSDAQSSRFQLNKVASHTSGRFAFDFVLADLRRAGYSDKTKITDAVGGVKSESFAVSDQLEIRYDAALVENQDCVGNPIVATPTNNQVVNTYRVQTVDGVNVLMCNDNPLMAGVDGFQVLFGVDTDNNGTPETYVEPGDQPAGADVVTVQIAMLVAAQERDGENIEQQYQLLNVNSGPMNDRRARTLFTATERIRNINTDEIL